MSERTAVGEMLMLIEVFGASPVMSSRTSSGASIEPMVGS
jgi:hypothetical protein